MGQNEENVPRRLRRFYRNGQEPTQREVKDMGTELAIKEVDSFKKTHARYPQSGELEEISQNVFDQMKKELSRQASIEDIDLGKLKDDKNLLESRRERRGKIAKEALKKGKKDEAKEVKPETIKAQEEVEEDKEEENSEDFMEEFDQDESMPQNEDLENVKKLAELDELSSLEKELSIEDDSDLVEREMDSSLNKCPTCSTKTKEFIYCPNCGEAFCNHCAKSVEVGEQSIRYTCPKCGNEFKKSK